MHRQSEAPPRRGSPPRGTLFARSRGLDRRLVGPALGLALLLLVLGLVLPTMEVETFPLLADSVSVLGGLVVLWREGEFLLFAVLLVFSVLFPAAKLSVGLWAWYGADLARHPPERLVGRIERLGRWSMLDVLVVAIVVAALNLTLIAGVFVHAGLYLFTASVVLSMAALGRVRAACAAASRAIGTR